MKDDWTKGSCSEGIEGGVGGWVWRARTREGVLRTAWSVHSSLEEILLGWRGGVASFVAVVGVHTYK